MVGVLFHTHARLALDMNSREIIILTPSLDVVSELALSNRGYVAQQVGTPNTL